ncbi:MAG: aspartate 1-decarboxylase [Calditrichaceae bacterium]|nr:aspartate 1-decarboxylase [Calditrichaceae bacterium]MBN2708219.1 aspartate 1-decarboxylase [Calditrichaceae bacterium]RQV92243.1 MAG: aspartate 1-decarboxylase [Calditrichota bacterium]
MFRQVLKSKIQNVIITNKELNYNGSIGIDQALIQASDMIPGEKVQVLNFNNGKRFETYIIEEKPDSGIIALYGPAARQGEIGDKLCIISYAFINHSENESLKPKIILVDQRNKPL